MNVEALDHVNIRTADVVGTSRFFVDLLSLELRDAPGIPDRTKACWLYDSGGRAVIHVAAPTVAYPWENEPQTVPPGSGRVHHVALRCVGYASMLDRLREQHRPYNSSGVPQVGLRQLFVQDPNGILLELNFFGD